MHETQARRGVRRGAAVLLAMVLALSLGWQRTWADEERQLIPVGKAVGIKLFADGVLVVSVSPVQGAEETRSPAKECGLKEGDILLTFNGEKIRSTEHLQAMLAENGALSDMIAAGARILECACGPCIGMGQSPRTNAVSVRTNNRNFYGRSGTKSAGIYLVSCETAAVTALTGVLTDPRCLDIDLDIPMPETYTVNDNLVIPPVAPGEEDTVEVVRGPNIQPFPLGKPLADAISGKVLLKMEDNITTDHIAPSDAKLLPFRSNVPYLSDFCLTPVDATFPARAKKEGGGILVAGMNYGQGSSREHAALVPLYLGIRAVVAKSFARIHQANLINNGILPLTFQNEADYDRIAQGDTLSLPNVRETVESGSDTFVLHNDTKDEDYIVLMPLTARQQGCILYGGLLNYTRESAKAE